MMGVWAPEKSNREIGKWQSISKEISLGRKRRKGGGGTKQARSIASLPQAKNALLAASNKGHFSEKQDSVLPHSEFVPANRTFRRVQKLLLAKEKAIKHWDLKDLSFSDKTRNIHISEGRLDISEALDVAKLDLVEKLSKEDERSLTLLTHQAKHAMLHSKYDNALTYLNKAATIQENSQVRILRGRCLLKLRLYYEACGEDFQ